MLLSAAPSVVVGMCRQDVLRSWAFCTCRSRLVRRVNIGVKRRTRGGHARSHIGCGVRGVHEYVDAADVILLEE